MQCTRNNPHVHTEQLPASAAAIPTIYTKLCLHHQQAYSTACLGGGNVAYVTPKTQIR